MSLTFRKPVENTMAFGGVATGSRKAKDAEMVHGIMKYNGFTPSCTAWKKNQEKSWKSYDWTLAIVRLHVTSCGPFSLSDLTDRPLSNSRKLHILCVFTVLRAPTDHSAGYSPDPRRLGRRGWWWPRCWSLLWWQRWTVWATYRWPTGPTGPRPRGDHWPIWTARIPGHARWHNASSYFSQSEWTAFWRANLTVCHRTLQNYEKGLEIVEFVRCYKGPVKSSSAEKMCLALVPGSHQPRQNLLPWEEGLPRPVSRWRVSR